MRISATFLLLAVGFAGPAISAETLPLPHGCKIAGNDMAMRAGRSDEPAFPPVQLEIRTPFEPWTFAAGGYSVLLYELHLTNFTAEPMSLRGMEVVDATGAQQELVATYEGAGMFETLVGIGTNAPSADQPLDAGRGAVFFVCLAFETGHVVPEKLRHRVLLSGSVAEGPVVEVGNGHLKVLGPPVSGDNWMAVSGLGFSAHHRSGLFVAGGLAQISRRYAVDWKKVENGAFFSGEALDVSSYFTYGEVVLAVADATVVLARDDLPDNVPRTPAGFSTAVPVTMDTVAGNSIVLDLGDGLFANYAHLKAGSLLVEVGDTVRRGQPLALIGNSGDAREPHLHFQVTTNPGILDSEGVPYVIDHFEYKDADGNWQVRVREFPLGGGVINFPGERAPTAGTP